MNSSMLYRLYGAIDRKITVATTCGTLVGRLKEVGFDDIVLKVAGRRIIIINIKQICFIIIKAR